MTIAVVVADANILFSRTLRDYFLHAAAEGAIEIHWSQAILDEMLRNLRLRLGLGGSDTARLERLMNDYIEYALVEVDPASLSVVETSEVDPEDRHVLAAALSVEADVLLTENVKHFPREWMGDRGIELLTAGELLGRLAISFPDQIRAAHDLTVRYSPRTEAQVLTTLEGIIGTAAADSIRALTAPPEASQ